MSSSEIGGGHRRGGGRQALIEALVRVTRQVFRDRVSRRPFILPLVVRI